MENDIPVFIISTHNNRLQCFLTYFFIMYQKYKQPTQIYHNKKFKNCAIIKIKSFI